MGRGKILWGAFIPSENDLLRIRISEYRACALCALGTEAASVPVKQAPVTGAAADGEYNLNAVDCNASVTVARRSSISVSEGTPGGGKRER